MVVVRTAGLNLQEYQEFKDWALKRSITYGPFPTRRKGFSLGINLLPPEYKLCNFNCIYCQCGWSKYNYEQLNNMGLTFPSLSDIRNEIEQTFINIHKGFLISPNNIVISGNGEPTLYPHFDEAIDIIIELKNNFFPNIPISVLSDGGKLHIDTVITGLNKVDERIIKLDAGSDELLQKICIPLEDFSISYLLTHIKKLKDVIIQCCFVNGIVSNTTENNISQWIKILKIIKPQFVQIYSIDRIPPSPGLKKVPLETLQKIAEEIQKETNIEAKVY